ncbi:hypothetical protein [Sporanaerobacter sp. PP17-6a]|uniref:hypothetical protein n=1 Tax=Sporanaerobacter sp. PP17-6a TaxID=1891289 RepID=UPI00089FF876|nr:hypothetical protein [Sporanaerobacter sp. PP17-6a]SCL87922.1 hypothetical protein PP176A_1421 [Sporanaerobacter sp. PP17-6a]
MNKNLIIAKLEILNILLREKIEDSNVRVCADRIEQYTVAKNKEYFEKEIEENEALIKELREDTK